MEAEKIKILSGKNIICISTSDWDSHWGSRQHIMSILSKKNCILFVEYQASILHPLRYKNIRKRKKYNGLRKIKERLFVYRPKLNLPFGYYLNCINKINQKYLLVQIKRIMDKLNIKKPILWIFAPCSCEIVDKLNEEISIYHCIDSFKNEKLNSFRRNTIERMERKLLEKTDIIFASSKKIYEEFNSFHKNTFIISSGADNDFLEYKLEEEIPVDMQNIAHPIIGFVGTFDDRLDISLIEYLLHKEKKWSFVFIGSVIDKKSTTKLSKYKNIHFLGFKKKDELPAYVKNFDICTIPYKVNEFTQGISPVKVYEYLSLGKPTVATPLPEILSLSNQNLIKTAENKEEFIESIDRYLNEKEGHEAKRQRRAFVLLNTWQNRTERISELISEYIKNNR